MATLTPGAVIETILTWDTSLASVAQNVWHYIMVSGTTVDSDDLLAAILTQQQVAFAIVDSHVSNAFAGVLLEIREWDFTFNRFDGIGSLAATLLTGLSAIDYEPHGVAALGRVKTASARRQGGTFLPGFIENAVDEGVLVAGAEADLALYLAAWDTDLAPTGGIFSWCTFNVDPLSPLFETASIAIQTVLAKSLPSYLGKRKPGVGL